MAMIETCRNSEQVGGLRPNIPGSTLLQRVDVKPGNEARRVTQDRTTVSG